MAAQIDSNRVHVLAELPLDDPFDRMTNQVLEQVQAFASKVGLNQKGQFWCYYPNQECSLLIEFGKGTGCFRFHPLNHHENPHVKVIYSYPEILQAGGIHKYRCNHSTWSSFMFIRMHLPGAPMVARIISGRVEMINKNQDFFSQIQEVIKERLKKLDLEEKQRKCLYLSATSLLIFAIGFFANLRIKHGF